MCSQAIMLVTDGATEMYDDVFAKYNWPEQKVHHPNHLHVYTHIYLEKPTDAIRTEPSCDFSRTLTTVNFHRTLET